MDIAVHHSRRTTHPVPGKGRRIGIRVSSLPATAGEVIVMRLMDVSEQLLSLDELGFSEEDDLARALIHRPAGMIVLRADELGQDVVALRGAGGAQHGVAQSRDA